MAGSSHYFDARTEQYVEYTDAKEQVYSAKCRTADIKLITTVPKAEAKRIREDIAVDIAINQGYNAVGIRRNI